MDSEPGMPETQRTAGRRRLLRRAGAGALIYAVIAAGLAACGVADRVLLHPQRAPLELPAGAERTTIPHGPGRLEIIKARSPEFPGEPKSFMLRFYGNADRADRWVAAEAAAERGPIEYWGVNYPGFGGSDGPTSLATVAESGLAAYDALAKVAGDRPIMVMGTSMGAAVALHVAANRKVEALIVQNPPALRQIIRGDHGWWNLWLLALPISWGVPDSIDAIENARRSRVPAFFVISEADEIVAPRYQAQVYDAYGGPKTEIRIPGARHDDPTPPEIRARLRQELTERVFRQP
jgi:pimeloyl-ACP methyl ester carboxylesterase